MNRSVPVLYYHRVGAPDPIHLSVPTPLFAAQMAYLARHGWKTLTMRQLIDHVTGIAPAPRKSLAITFDDGFRDNLTEAMPILKQHGLRATVFAVGSLVRPDSSPPAREHRPFTTAHTAARRGDLGDFLSEAELDLLLENGIETHSHGWEHSQAFCGSRITGFYPRTDDHWAIPPAWRGVPDVSDLPVFPRKPGLVVNAWVPNKERFRRLLEAGDTHMTIGSELESGFFEIETDAQRERRVRDDLSKSRQRFERWHESGCDVFCWPWGAHDELTRRVAREVGYRGALATSTGANAVGIDPFAIHRFPVKKSGLARFVVGLWLRAHPVASRVYGFLRGRV
ncbi:MAG TPA: polysaccharide deacetylase family protein [Candidatus Ozemobacteraceae bacterium]|mgnify:CR=1 FL=1|nr:polysaccharide deacetylase family protein [Candidatus Ozemobacteraceae bacterium]